MSKLCQHCGAEMDDEALECPECLEKIPGADAIRRRREEEKKAKKQKVIRTVSAAVLAVAFITGLTILVTVIAGKKTDSYTKPIDTYIKGCVKNEYQDYISAFPDYYQMMLSQQFAYIVIGDMTDDPDKIYTADLLYHDQYYRELAQKFGSNFEITYKVHKEDRISPEKLEQYQGEYQSYNPEALADIVFEDGYELALTFTVKGNLGSNNVTMENFQIIKINGRWCIMSYVDFFYEKEKTNLENMR